jgi:hypothetical protein
MTIFRNGLVALLFSFGGFRCFYFPVSFAARTPPFVKRCIKPQQHRIAFISAVAIVAVVHSCDCRYGQAMWEYAFLPDRWQLVTH